MKGFLIAAAIACSVFVFGCRQEGEPVADRATAGKGVTAMNADGKMDLSKFKNTHEWYEAVGYPDGDIPHELLGQLVDLRSHLWDKHYASLSDEDRKLVDSDSHPFDDADRYEDAVKFARDFIDEKEKLDYVDTVSVDYYHGHTLVLTVRINRNMHWKEYSNDIPELYRGVPVFVHHAERT